MSPAPKHSCADHCSMTYKDPETLEAPHWLLLQQHQLCLIPALYADSTFETHPEHQTELRLKSKASRSRTRLKLKALGFWADISTQQKLYLVPELIDPSTMCDYYQNFYIYSTCTNAALHFFRTSMDGNAATKCPKSPHGRYIVVAGTCPHCRWSHAFIEV